MIYITFEKDGQILSGALLASYRKANIELSEKCKQERLEKKFLVCLTLAEGREILELSEDKTIAMTLNLVAEMVNKENVEFEFVNVVNGERKTKLVINDFYGYPFVCENADFFIEPINQEKCLRILRTELSDLC